MKKVLLSLAFLLVFVVSYSQDYSYRIGVKGGLDYADLRASGNYAFSKYRGFTIGAFTEVSRSDIENVFLRGGINYSKKGLGYSGGETTNQYLEIPIQIGYKYPALNFMSVYALVGPSFGVRTYGNGFVKTGSSNTDWQTQNMSAGLEAEIGFEFLKHYQLEAGYQYGLTPYYKGSDFSGKNSTFTVTVGLAF